MGVQGAKPPKDLKTPKVKNLKSCQKPIYFIDRFGKLSENFLTNFVEIG